MASPEVKVDKDCSEKLQKIDAEITKAKSDLERFENSTSPEVQSEVENAKKRLADLEKQREKIITETQSCLKSEKVGKQEVAQVQANLNNTNLSGEEKAKVGEALQQQNSGTFDFSKIEDGGIMGIIIAILQAILGGHGILGGENEYAEVDSSGKEIAGTRMKGKETTSKNKEAFIATHKEIAKRVGAEYNIPWQVIISQAGLESTWGTSLLATKYNNYFGIKSFGKPPSVRLMTKENQNGKLVDVLQDFKVYGSMEESFVEHAKFLTENKRYKPAFAYSNDPVKFAIEIAKAGYATDKDYAGKLTGTMRNVA